MHPYLSRHKMHFYFNTGYLFNLYYITIPKKCSSIRNLSQFWRFSFTAIFYLPQNTHTGARTHAHPTPQRAFLWTMDQILCFLIIPYIRYPLSIRPFTGDKPASDITPARCQLQCDHSNVANGLGEGDKL